MSPRPQVLVATGSGTLGLRLRLMLEAEGAEVALLADGAGDSSLAAVGLVVTTPGQAARARAVAPQAAVVEVDEGEDWDAIRKRLASALRGGGDVTEAEQMAAALAQARILLVDDSVTYREFLRLELLRLGAAVTACSNAEEAMSNLASGSWDCVLVDLVMPGVDGAELCSRAARLRREQGRTFVLAVLSSREGKADLIRSLEAGADAFIGKSLDMPLFQAKLGAMLRRRFLLK